MQSSAANYPLLSIGMGPRAVKKDRAGPHGRLTVNTSDGTGVRSCGWIMERTEGRWPSLDPTKNSLWMEQWAISPGPATQT